MIKNLLSSKKSRLGRGGTSEIIILLCFARLRFHETEALAFQAFGFQAFRLSGFRLSVFRVFGPSIFRAFKFPGLSGSLPDLSQAAGLLTAPL